MTIAQRKELKRTSIVEVYLRTLRKNSSIFADLKRQAESTIKWAKERGYPEPKFATRVFDICRAQLDWITCREAEIRDIKTSRDRKQMPLVGVAISSSGATEEAPAVEGRADIAELRTEGMDDGEREQNA